MTDAPQRLAKARRVVIKVGSSLLVDWETGAADAAWLASLARDAARLAGVSGERQREECADRTRTVRRHRP